MTTTGRVRGLPMSDRTVETTAALPKGVELLTEPWVAIGNCEECGAESGDGYNAMLPLKDWRTEVEGWGWMIIDDRLLCFDCIPPEPTQ